MSEATSELGAVSRDGEAVVLTYERRLSHPQEKVWRAITESEHLRHWFPTDIVLAAGAERTAGVPLRFPFWPEAVAKAGDEIEAAGLDPNDAVVDGELLAWEPPELFEFRWDTERVRFELEARDAGTRLVVTVRATEPAVRGFQSNAAGYHLCLDALVAHVDGTDVTIFDDARTKELEQAYAALV